MFTNFFSNSAIFSQTPETSTGMPPLRSCSKPKCSLEEAPSPAAFRPATTRPSMASPTWSPRMEALKLEIATARPSPNFSPILWLAALSSAILPMTSWMGSFRAWPIGVPRMSPIMWPSFSPASCAACLTAPSTRGIDWFSCFTTFSSTTFSTSPTALLVKSSTCCSSRSMAAGVEYFIITFRKPSTLLTIPLICVAKESRALLDWDEYSKHSCW
mmetsp:Transcript_123817/g.361514  ORF Transcript_123817/g.361514 Transcript_123817/m.361514 type:complete len:215 (-) Transcript_123817:1760-2404(-)